MFLQFAAKSPALVEFVRFDVWVWEKLKKTEMMRFIVISAVLALAQGLTPSSFLSSSDKSRLKTLFQAGLSEENNLSYAILGLKLLGEQVPNPGDLCKKLQTNIDNADVTSERIFSSTSAAKVLGSCTLKPNAKVGQVLYKAHFSVESARRELQLFWKFYAVNKLARRT